MGLLKAIRDAVKGDKDSEAPEAPEEPEVSLTFPVRRRASLEASPGWLGQAALPENFVFNVVSAVDSTPEPHRDENDFTHVSTLLNSPCPREIALIRKYKPEVVRPIVRGMKVIWALGRAAEIHVRDNMIAGAPDHIWGDWECRCGAVRATGTASDMGLEGPCEVCGTIPMKYREHALFDTDRGVIGSPDFLLRYGDIFTVVEVKSCNDKGFEQVKESGPSADNSLQALYYRRMLYRGLYNVHPFSIILYVQKDYKWGQVPYIECRVDADMKGYTISLDMMDQVAVEIKRVRDDANYMPGRLPVCKNPTNKRPKGCATCSLCFSV